MYKAMIMRKAKTGAKRSGQRLDWVPKWKASSKWDKNCLSDIRGKTEKMGEDAGTIWCGKENQEEHKPRITLIN